MDELKKGTCKDFTAWDLNCPRYVKPNNRLKKIFVRKYRRKSKLALDKQAKACYNQDTKTKEIFQMEERYWKLREECERAFDRWMADKRESNFQAYKEALSIYQDFCMDTLEMLMDTNADVLKNLKDYT